MKLRYILIVSTSIVTASGLSQPGWAMETAQPQASPSTSVDPSHDARRERQAAKRRARAERDAARERARADRRDAGRTQLADQTGTPEDVVVTGIRGSIESARRKKRSSREIVDSVVAEDVGKLPDNNVPEALARVAGVQIDRVHGEGSSVTIRGLSDIQTTINGYEAGTAGSRALSLADIPAELLKSVDVYKTRSASQPEGGIAGTVNVELRRPLDLGKGLTVAGSFRETFADIGSTKSPYGSLLIAERFDTGIGEMGFLLNGSLTKNNYNENFVAAESPLVAGIYDGSPGQLSLPLAQRGLLIPYRVTYGAESGSIKRPSLNASWQWRPNEHLDFVIEGSYLGVRQTAASDYLNLVTNDGSGAYSNVVANSDGTIRSLTISSATGVNGGPLELYQKTRSDTYTTNFETHWTGGKTHINLGVQYNWSNTDYYFVQQAHRLTGGTTADVDFNSGNIPGGGPYISFPNSDLASPGQYKLFQVHDQDGTNNDTLFATNVDITVDTSSTGLLRSFQFGGRYTRRTMGYSYGYRDAFFFDTPSAPSLTSVGNGLGIGLASTTPAIRNATVPTWYHFDNASYYDKFDAVRAYIIANGADLQGRDWTTATPGGNDPGSGYEEKEQTFASYAQANYGFNAHFPVDGTLGLRYTNTWGSAASAQFGYLVSGTKADPIYTLQVTNVSTKENYVDLLPSATMTMHFTPKLQLRLSYTHNVQRPQFQDLRNFKELRNAIANPATGIVYAGNPDLKPVQENSYDASLEYYFGQGGLLSLGGFLKNQTGFIYYTELSQFVPELGRSALVGQPRNAGPGKIAGLEAQGNTFFDFLPGFARHFGASANFTYIPVAQLHLYPDDQVPDVPGIFQPPFTSTYTGNASLYYDTPVFSARLAYNYRSKYKTYIDYVNPGYSVYSQATSRLDAAINYTPFTFVTFNVEATNILRNNDNTYFGAYTDLPVGVREQARTIQVGARFRF
jgi:TonB-dependent receptor